MAAKGREKILLVYHYPFVGQLILEVLQAHHCGDVDLCHSLSEAKRLFTHRSYSLVLLDHNVEEERGFHLLHYFLEKRPEVPVVMLVDAGVVDLVVECMRKGAFDAVSKPIHPDRITAVVKRALEYGFVRTEIVRFHAETHTGDVYHGLVGRSPAMKKIFNLIERIKDSSVSILITGPSGSGKEMVARALHETSPRAGKKFVAINCSAIPYNLLEGELFGYKKGAFTDARTDKTGLFEEANSGTIFLDEIGDMPITIQPKILRALQEREIRPLGSTQTVRVDVRIVAATNQDLKNLIEEKKFREDLYYRLNAMRLDLPPLRERPADIPLLIDYFLEKLRKKSGHAIKGLSQKSMKCILDYSWPGNVRELENVIERATLLTRNDVIMPEDLLFVGTDDKDQLPLSEWAHARKSLYDIEKEYIIEVLNLAGGNRSETAEILKIGRKTLYNKLAKYGMMTR